MHWSNPKIIFTGQCVELAGRVCCMLLQRRLTPFKVRPAFSMVLNMWPKTSSHSAPKHEVMERRANRWQRGKVICRFRSQQATGTGMTLTHFPKHFPLEVPNRQKAGPSNAGAFYHSQASGLPSDPHAKSLTFSGLVKFGSHH